VRRRGAGTAVLFLLLGLPGLPGSAPFQGLSELRSRIEKERGLPAEERREAIRALCARATRAARRLALELAAREEIPDLEALLLAHAAGLPGIEAEMLRAVEEGETSAIRDIGARWFAERDGARGLEVLAALLEESSDGRVRVACLRALGRASGKAEAAILFRKRISGLSPSNRREVLRGLSGVDTAVVAAFRREALEDPDPRLRGEAILQAVLRGDEKARRAARKEARGKDRARMAPQLFEALAHRPESADLDLMAGLRALRVPRQALEEGRVLERLRREPVARAWAEGAGAESGLLEARCFALALLEGLEGGEAEAAILRLAADREPSLRIEAYGVLGRRGIRRAVPLLERALDRGSEAARAAALEALFALRGGETSFLEGRLFRIAKSGPASLRLLALDLAARTRNRVFLSLLPDLCRDRDWRFRAAGAALAGKIRDASSIPLLIRALAGAEGRLRDDFRRALASLTRLYFMDVEGWERWWRDAREDFELPPPPPPGNEGGRPEPAGGTKAVFYGLPVTSTRVVFCLDVSGSMGRRRGTGATRFEIAKRELRNALERAPAESRVNLIFFDREVRPFAKSLRPLRRRGVLERMKAFLAKIRPVGGTNLFGALETAFADPEVDTIFLLSDGEPSAGRILDPETIAAEIRRRNQSRRIVLHCISIGGDGSLLRRLARESGGRFVRR